MHVIAHCLQMAVAAAANWESFVTSGEKVAAGFVADVKALGVNAKQPFHAGDEVRLRCFDDEVKMIAHEGRQA